MTSASLVLQIVIALGLLNVWLLRFNKPTSYRGGSAKNLKEEFATYGLPDWFLYLIGFLKLSTAAALVLGVWMPALVVPAASLLAVLMLGAVIMHVKVKDPFIKSVPAGLMLAMSLMLAIPLV